MRLESNQIHANLILAEITDNVLQLVATIFANALQVSQVNDVIVKCKPILANQTHVKTEACVRHNRLADTEWVVVVVSLANAHQVIQVNAVRLENNLRIHVNQTLVKTLDDVCNQQMDTNANVQLDMEVETVNNKIFAM